jgi:hypothetical protein
VAGCHRSLAQPRSAPAGGWADIWPRHSAPGFTANAPRPKSSPPTSIWAAIKSTRGHTEIAVYRERTGQITEACARIDERSAIEQLTGPDWSREPCG